MDPISIASLALSAAPGIFKGITGIFQRNQDVQRTDTTPAAFSESLAMQRQAANSALMPGYTQQANAIAQGQAAGVQNATLGAASSGDFLASAQASAARAAQGQQQLGVQNEQFHNTAIRQLQQGLAQQAQYQVADNNRYNQAKAALQGNGLSNIFGGLSDAASAGVYAMNKDNSIYDPRNTDPRYMGSNSYYDQMTPRLPKLAPLSMGGMPK